MEGSSANISWAGRWFLTCSLRWRVVLVLAGACAVMAGILGHSVEDHLSTASMLPAHAESRRADRALEQHFRLGEPQLVFLAQSDTRVDTAEATKDGLRLTQRLIADRAVAHLRSYWTAGTAEREALLSRDGRCAVVAVRLRGGDEQVLRSARRLMDRESGQRGGFTISAAGEAATRVEIARQVEHDRAQAEMLALPITAMLLLFVFRSLIAALLPVIVGALAVLGMMAAPRGLAAFTEVSLFAVSVNSGLGFGLAVDYSLFLVSRYREEQARGMSAGDALLTSWVVAGRVVFFSATTVVLSLGALLAFPNTVLRSIAFGGITVVIFAAMVSLLVLPALITALDPWLDKGDIFSRWRSALSSTTTKSQAGSWGRLASWVSHRPLRVTLGSDRWPAAPSSTIRARPVRSAERTGTTANLNRRAGPRHPAHPISTRHGGHQHTVPSDVGQCWPNHHKPDR
ncbi:MMPL family transporter [Streptomyces sp. ISL-98]|uniref:MMPL family transporter n=1 Tax=Streptomyces sp. ISL-98 TaxID=2819192 RepID=UPI001BE65D0E|nr:MMPL family transporter [Streptomyces sp. ISL-98]MBT2511717.1 MMPL family transporter [Streptomyces sp. ISL-98]